MLSEVALKWTLEVFWFVVATFTVYTIHVDSLFWDQNGEYCRKIWIPVCVHACVSACVCACVSAGSPPLCVQLQVYVWTSVWWSVVIWGDTPGRSSYSPPQTLSSPPPCLHAELRTQKYILKVLTCDIVIVTVAHQPTHHVEGVRAAVLLLTVLCVPTLAGWVSMFDVLSSGSPVNTKHIHKHTHTPQG